jgi:dipeptidyl aminopeptidase/acylaminoacyl peptidase
MRKAVSFFWAICALAIAAGAQQTRPLISLDEFLSTTEIRAAKISPDGQAVVVATSAPDWRHNRYREELWLWRQSTGALALLTEGGADARPEWSPDGKYLAFVSSRPLAGEDEEDKDKDETERVWVIAADGGEAFPLYREKLETHAFAWSPDGSRILFAVQQPLAEAQEQEQKQEWKDVVRWREQERGDVLLALRLDAAKDAATKVSLPENEKKEKGASALPSSAQVIARSNFAIAEIAPYGEKIAFETESVSHRMEDPHAAEVYLVEMQGGTVQQLTHNEGLENNLRWSPEGKRLYFLVRAAGGSVEGPYRDVQGRLYALDPGTGKIARLGSSFEGSWEGYTVTADGQLLATGQLGTEQQVYAIDGDKAEAVPGLAGTYSGLDAARQGQRLVVLHSTVTDPTQVFLAEGSHALEQAKAVTAFNPVFQQRAQVEWSVYRWKAEDGTAVEGMLIYPPGKKGAKHLPMLTLIHGGPADADGNRFGADWYDWATLAAANGWLVFRPNYRGSSGYGDRFMLGIAPHLVSRPGKDILEGVDALVRDGIADPERLTIGGYSYGGYMTNWLITQTTRFRAAVTGAGAVEHAANWGNDDLTFDDAWYLGGRPWEDPGLYQSEAALFQFNKVRTPVHLVGGDADVRVSYLEDVLMERALEALGIPHAFLVFPGEGHSLSKNPWHGYIKVREELKWLQQYGGR